MSNVCSPSARNDRRESPSEPTSISASRFFDTRSGYSKIPSRRFITGVRISAGERDVQRSQTPMSECPRCRCDQLYRVSRTALERLLFTQSFECRMCGCRERLARQGAGAVLWLFPWLWLRRTKAGIEANVSE